MLMLGDPPAWGLLGSFDERLDFALYCLVTSPDHRPEIDEDDAVLALAWLANLEDSP